MYNLQSTILSFLFIVISANCYSQQTSSTFFKLIVENNLSDAYNLIAQQKDNSLTEEQFKATWKSINLSLGKLTEYEKSCDTITDSGLISYFDLNFEKKSVVFGVRVQQDKVLSFFAVQSAPCASKYSIAEYIDKNSFTEKNILINDSLNVLLTSPMKIDDSNIICIMLTGSGQQDSDGTIGANKPIKDLAVGLASKGIHTLRFSKKLVGVTEKYTIEDEYGKIVDNILKFISGKSEYQKFKIFIIGHSLGGMVAPTIGSQQKRVEGVIAVSANFRPMEDLLLQQTEYVLSLDKNSTMDQKQAFLSDIDSRIKYLKKDLNTSSPSNLLPFNVPASYWISLKKYDLNKRKIRKNITKPMLVLWGENDYQVPATELKLYKRYFSGAPNKFISYSNLNHILTKSDGTMSPAEYHIQQNIPEYVVSDIAAWIFHIAN